MCLYLCPHSIVVACLFAVYSLSYAAFVAFTTQCDSLSAALLELLLFSTCRYWVSCQETQGKRMRVLQRLTWRRIDMLHDSHVRFCVHYACLCGAVNCAYPVHGVVWVQQHCHCALVNVFTFTDCRSKQLLVCPWTTSCTLCECFTDWCKPHNMWWVYSCFEWTYYSVLWTLVLLRLAEWSVYLPR